MTDGIKHYSRYLCCDECDKPATREIWQHQVASSKVKLAGTYCDEHVRELHPNAIIENKDD